MENKLFIFLNDSGKSMIYNISKYDDSLENGEWVGCYLNGKKVLTKEEKNKK